MIFDMQKWYLTPNNYHEKQLQTEAPCPLSPSPLSQLQKCTPHKIPTFCKYKMIHFVFKKTHEKKYGKVNIVVLF